MLAVKIRPGCSPRHGGAELIGELRVVGTLLSICKKTQPGGKNGFPDLSHEY